MPSHSPGGKNTLAAARAHQKRENERAAVNRARRAKRLEPPVVDDDGQLLAGVSDGTMVDPDGLIIEEGHDSRA